MANGWLDAQEAAYIRGAARNRNKTHCVNGHRFTPENTGIRSTGRYCKACYREYARKQYLKKKGQV